MTDPADTPNATVSRRGLYAAMAGLLALGAAAAVTSDWTRLDAASFGDIELTAYSPADLEADLSRACAVTGCDAADLAQLFRAGIPAMSEAELAEAMILTQAIAAQSAATLADHDSRGAAQPELRARLKAQAEADAAVARFHEVEAARRRGAFSG